MAHVSIRVGQGYDVHRLTEGRALFLGGVSIPYHLGLLGHSDADVLTHAVMDALLGAAGLRDIGAQFPDSDPALKDISSMVLLARTAELLQKAGWQTVNVDATIIAQRPKLAQWIPDMARNIAAGLGVLPEQVNIKATTEEGLGFTGAGQGMAAQAVALIERI
jgi:2-C-methyl-D-erythritol 2,4-cyclodiphosphate synthase